MEAKLLAMQPPRQISCCYHRDEFADDECYYEASYYLGIQRIGGKWRVCHATTTGSTPEAKDWEAHQRLQHRGQEARRELCGVPGVPSR